MSESPGISIGTTGLPLVSIENHSRPATLWPAQSGNAVGRLNLERERERAKELAANVGATIMTMMMLSNVVVVVVVTVR